MLYVTPTADGIDVDLTEKELIDKCKELHNNSNIPASPRKSESQLLYDKGGHSHQFPTSTDVPTHEPGLSGTPGTALRTPIAPALPRNDVRFARTPVVGQNFQSRIEEAARQSSESTNHDNTVGDSGKDRKKANLTNTVLKRYTEKNLFLGTDNRSWR